MSSRSVFYCGRGHPGVHPDEGGQTLSGDSEHAATLPAPPGAARWGPCPLRLVMSCWKTT